MLITTAAAASLYAQAPDWSVNPADYQYSMTMTAFLTINGQELTSDQDQVAAFINGEVRGVAPVIYASGAERYLAYLTVYANANDEPVTFKVYDSGNNSIVDMPQQVNFGIDAQFGNAFQAFSLATPALNSEAEIIDFGFTYAPVVALSIVPGMVTVTVGYDEDLTALTPEFTVSEGAKIYRDGQLQATGENQVDFTDTVVYTVLSQDEANLVTYEVAVNNQQISTGDDFISTNVITPNNDGQNDYWVVQDNFKYNNYNFKIFDVNGRVLFESTGYENNWGGYFKGQRLDPGKYYYTVTGPASDTVIQGDILILY